MQKGYFKIGDSNKEEQLKSIYSQDISGTGGNLAGTEPALANRTHLKTSILFGNQGVNYHSEAKSQFLGEKNEGKKSALVDKAREQHFRFNDGGANEMISQTKQQFNDKGDPS